MFFDVDKRLFHPPGGFNYMSLKGLRASRGIAVHDDQLIISDFRRLLYWNGLNDLTTGQPADGRDKARNIGKILGIPVVAGSRPPNPAICGFSGLKAMTTSTYMTCHFTTDRLLSTRFGRDGLIFRSWAPIQELASATRLFGIAPTDDGRFLWLSDTDNHRVLRIRDPITNPIVDVILGQEEPSGAKCNRRAQVGPHSERDPEVYDDPLDNMLCFPGALSIDNLGNLYVADHSLEAEGNWKIANICA